MQNCISDWRIDNSHLLPCLGVLYGKLVSIHEIFLRDVDHSVHFAERPGKILLRQWSELWVCCFLELSMVKVVGSDGLEWVYSR